MASQNELYYNTITRSIMHVIVITVERKHQRTRYMKATSASPVEFDKTRLFLIEEPDMKTPQLSHIVSPHNAEDVPVPINDHA